MIEAHQHLGDCRVFDLNVDEDALLGALRENGVEGAVVQPFPGARDPRATHDRIARLASSADVRIWGMASLSPHQDAQEYKAEVRRCVSELGFVAVKLHTIGHAVNPTGSDASLVFEVAQELDIAVMVHTGDGVPFADPTAIMARARDNPELRIILAHAGGAAYAGNAIQVAKACPNVYLETSWCKTPQIGAAIAAVGADRVLLGADLPVNLASEIAKYRSLGLSARDFEAVTERTAVTVFGLQ